MRKRTKADLSSSLCPTACRGSSPTTTIACLIIVKKKKEMRIDRLLCANS